MSKLKVADFYYGAVVSILAYIVIHTDILSETLNTFAACSRMTHLRLIMRVVKNYLEFGKEIGSVIGSLSSGLSSFLPELELDFKPGKLEWLYQDFNTKWSAIFPEHHSARQFVHRFVRVDRHQSVFLTAEQGLG